MAYEYPVVTGIEYELEANGYEGVTADVVVIGTSGGIDGKKGSAVGSATGCMEGSCMAAGTVGCVFLVFFGFLPGMHAAAPPAIPAQQQHNKAKVTIHSHSGK